VTPNERINVFAKGEYDIADHVKFQALASFNNRKSQGRAAPVPLFFGLDGGSTPYMVNFFMPADHPFNPFDFDLDGTTNATFRHEAAD
jgi:iron complex outermembrane receptor protein